VYQRPSARERCCRVRNVEPASTASRSTESRCSWRNTTTSASPCSIAERLVHERGRRDAVCATQQAVVRDQDRTDLRSVDRRIPDVAGEPNVGEAGDRDRLDRSVALDGDGVRAYYLGLFAERPEEVVEIGLQAGAHHRHPGSAERLDLFDRTRDSNAKARRCGNGNQRSR
jgi:hypothetical protein